MTTEAHRLLDLLVRMIHQGRFVPGKPETYVGYKECHDLLALQRRGGTWGRSLQRQGLNELAEWLHGNHIPAITGLIIDTTKGYRPGHGYFTCFNNGIEDDSWWREEIRRAIAFDWSAHSSAEQLPSRREIREVETLYSEGERSSLRLDIRKRCENLVQRAKSYFRSSDGEIHCAACDWHRPTKHLRGDIVEIHHMKPIAEMPQGGVKWTFREAVKSLAPLCPNCHRVAHARPGGETYTLRELKQIMKP